jgi:hypothetical protein
MNDKFDELAKDLAQSVTRRGALKKFSAGLACVVLASLGFARDAKADPNPKTHFHCICSVTGFGCYPSSPTYNDCITYCGTSLDKHACGRGRLYRFLRNLLG